MDFWLIFSVQYCETTNRLYFRFSQRDCFQGDGWGGRCSAAAVAGAVGDARCAPPSTAAPRAARRHQTDTLVYPVDIRHWGFPGGSVVKNPFADTRAAGDAASIAGPGTSPGGGQVNLLQYSCLENPVDRGARWASGHGVTESRTWARLSAGAQADRKPEFHLNLEFVLLRTALPQAFCSKSISAQLKKEVWKGN